MTAQQTTGHDTVEINFPNGILGFEGCKRFTLHHQEKGGNTVYWLQAIDKVGLEFSLVNPVAYGLHYEFTLSDAEQALLKATSGDEVVVFLMLAMEEAQGGSGVKPGLMANIAGPIILNVNSRLGLQKVLAKVDYSLNLQEG
ncbi:MAG: flagellar assembly protein FliW [Desulfobulbaceae bacterium]|nr:flagellar assembly protein FliW [Desulfobulbaceae bacterium]